MRSPWRGCGVHEGPLAYCVYICNDVTPRCFKMTPHIFSQNRKQGAARVSQTPEVRKRSFRAFTAHCKLCFCRSNTRGRQGAGISRGSSREKRGFLVCCSPAVIIAARTYTHGHTIDRYNGIRNLFNALCFFFFLYRSETQLRS